MQNVEKRIITALIASCDQAGYLPLKFWDGEDYQSVAGALCGLDSATAGAIDCINSVDEGTLHFAPKTDIKAWGRTGVLLILGNGIDVISDWHCGDKTFDAAVEAVAMNCEQFA